MSIQIRRIAPGSDVTDFLNVPRKIYRGDPNWVCPLDMEMSDRLNPKKNPFWLHGDGMYFVAERDGELVGRITAQIDHEHQKRYADGVGFFGFLDTVEDPAVAQALLDAAAAWLRERGMKSIRGPMSLSINEEIGTLIEGFDTPPMIMMPYHKPYQGGLIEAAGFAKAKDVYQWLYPFGNIPPRAQRAREALLADPSVKIRMADKSQMHREVGILMEIFNDTWSDNWGFVPMTEEERKKTAEDFKLVMLPDIALIAEVDGEPAAISVGLPNVNEAIRDINGKLFPIGFAKFLWRLKVSGVKSGRLILLGVKKKFRVQKKYAAMSLALYVEMAMRAAKLGMTHAELGWTLEDNGAVNAGIRGMGGKLAKKYRIYEKAL